jgi:hypothetical protein
VEKVIIHLFRISAADPDPTPDPDPLDRMFLGFLDPDPDPLVRGMDPYPDPSISENSKKNLDSYCFVTYF